MVSYILISQTHLIQGNITAGGNWTRTGCAQVNETLRYRANITVCASTEQPTVIRDGFNA